MKQHNIINVINLPERELRLSQFNQEAINQGFGYVVWDGIICIGDNKKGILAAHKQIVKFAKDNNFRSIIIAEDDCRFFANGAWRYFVSKIPEDYDIFFGMIYVADLVENRITGLFSGMTMYCINERFYDFFLSLPESCHVDRELGKYSDQFKFIVCDQFVCEQDGSISDNTKTTCNYRPYLESRKLFGI